MSFFECALANSLHAAVSMAVWQGMAVYLPVSRIREGPSRVAPKDFWPQPLKSPGIDGRVTIG
jgi:hypothetical protein